MKLRSKALAIGLVSAVCLISTGASAKGVRGTGLPISSYAEIAGRGLHPDWPDGRLGVSPLDGPYAPPLLDKEFPKTAAQAQMTAGGISSIDQCTQYGATEKEILSLTVVPTGDTIDINYSTQTNVSSGTFWASSFFVCSATQSGSTATCSSTNDNPALVTRVPVSNTSRPGAVGMFNYHGYVTGLTAGVPVKVYIGGFARGLPANSPWPGLLGQNCYSNLTVRY
jgi:hypothetical protein